jgi:exosortase
VSETIITSPSDVHLSTMSRRTGTAAAPVSWHDLLFSACLVSVAAAALADAWASIVELGIGHEDLGYVLIAPLMIAWMALMRREQFAGCRRRGEWVGLLMLAGGGGLYQYGYYTDPVLWRAGAVLAAVGAAITALGTDFFARFAPAIGACAFLIPISPNGRFRLAVPLQNITAQATQAVCDLLGINVQRSGSTLTINGTDVAVTEACNGMRMILTLLLVCYVVAFTIPMRPWIRFIFLALSPVVAIVCNVARLVPTVWFYGNTSRETAERFHDMSGWVMSVVAFVVLLAACWLMHRLAATFSGLSCKPEGIIHTA